MLTPLSESVCRREQYSVAEKLLSWSGLRFSLIILLTSSIFVAGMIRAESSPFDLAEIDPVEEKVVAFAALMVAPLLWMVGVVSDRIGRLMTLMIVLAIGAALEAAPSFSSSIYSILRDIFSPMIAGLSLLLAYESVPLRWRLVSVLALSAAFPVGKTLLEITLCKIESAGLYRTSQNVTANIEFENQQTFMFSARLRRIIIVCSLCLCVLASALLLRSGRESLLFQSLRNSGKTYDIATQGRWLLNNSQEVSGPVPFSREEFIINSRIDEDRFFRLMGRISGPFLLVISMAVALGFLTYLSASYALGASEAIFGKESPVFMPSVLSSAIEVVVIIGAIVVWFMSPSDLRYISTFGFLLASIGAIVLISFPATRLTEYQLEFDEGREDKIDWFAVGSGYIITAIGLPLVKSTLTVLAADLFPTQYRGFGVMFFEALIGASKSIAVGCAGSGHSQTAADIGMSAYVSIAYLAGFAGLYVTHWFDRSLICRDPEDDAHWLVPEKRVVIF